MNPLGKRFRKGLWSRSPIPVLAACDHGPMDRRWLCSAATLRGDRPTNQDQVVVVDGAAAVLDGATSWLRDPGDPRDGGWYARALGAALTARLPGAERTLTGILADAIAEVRDAHGLTPGDSPYSTASIARWTQDEIDVLVLGDSPVLVQAASGEVEMVADDRLAGTASSQRAAYREHLAAGEGFDARFAGLIAAVQRSERAAFNREDGFWVAEADPAAAEHALTESWRVDDVVAVALMSDGVSAAVTDYGLTDWSGLIAGVGERSPNALLADVHAAEATDPDGRRWPRTKRHDDKSLVFLSSYCGATAVPAATRPA
jgi:hypothetical protein